VLMVFPIGHPIGSPLAPMVTRAAVRYITERRLKRVGAGTIGRQQAPRHPRVGGQPLLHRLGLMDCSVIYDHVASPLPFRRIACIDTAEQVAEQRVGCAWLQAMVQRPRGECQGPSAGGLLVLAWGHDRELSPCGHPGTADVGPQVDSQFVSDDHGLTQFEVLEDLAHAGQALDAAGSVVFGHQCGALPHPAAHHNRIGRASRSPSRVRRNAASICACSSGGRSTTGFLGIAGSPRSTGVWQRLM
jgi:hypothetical protein